MQPLGGIAMPGHMRAEMLGQGMAKGSPVRRLGVISADMDMETKAAAAAPMAEEEANGGGAETAEPTVRKNFADTAFWTGSLMTDQQGTAMVRLKMPENLTTWKIGVWAMGQGTRVGQAETLVVTRKDLILQLITPRFFGRNRPGDIFRRRT